MPLPAAAPISAPTPNHLLPDQHRRKVQNNIKGKLRLALDYMVFGPPPEGDKPSGALAWNDAATRAGFSVQAMRSALERPHVRAYLKAQKDVFRSAASAQNISALVKLRDDSGNGMVQLGAIKTLEQMGDEPGANSPGLQQRAGMVIVVLNGANAGATIEQSLNQPMKTLQSLTNTQESTPLRGERRDVGPHDDDE